MPKNLKVLQVFAPIGIAFALIYGGYKHLCNQSKVNEINSNPKTLETKVVQEYVPEKGVPEKPKVKYTPTKPQVNYEKKKIVVLDPGHGLGNRQEGAYDSGAVSGNFRESDIVLNQAKKIKEILEQRGYEVYLTREDNKTQVNYSERVKIAERLNADAFVSLHCNAYDSESVNGQETFYSNENSKLLAGYVHSNMLHKIGDKNINDRGIKQRELRVLKTNIPSILIESGFITNSKDRKYLTDNIDDVEIGIANGIEGYLEN